MKKILLTTMCAVLLFAACKKDDENTITKNASGLNEAEYFIGNFMNIDSAGNMLNRFVGEPLESDTTVVSICVKDVDEADEMAYSFLPDSVTIKGDKTNWQYDLKDTLKNTQATLQYVHESGDYFASITVSGDCSEYVSRIQFVDVNSNNYSEEYVYGEKITKYIKNYGTAEFTCINNEAPYYFVHVSDKKYSKTAHDTMHYAQMPYAANLATLKNLSKVVANEMSEELGAPTYWLKWDMHEFYKIWGDAESQYVYKLYANILGEYITKGDFSCSGRLYDEDAKAEFFQWIEYRYESPEFWTMYNNHDYPYASIKATLRTYRLQSKDEENAVYETPLYKSFGSVYEDYHWSYISPCDGHKYIFVIVKN